MMRRRDLIAILGGAAVASPLGARAQQRDRVRRIAITYGLAANDPLAVEDREGLLKGLRELGWAEGRDFLLDISSVAGMNSASQISHWADMARASPDVILVAGGSSAVAGLRQSTRKIPIIFVGLIGDPVAFGFVASLARPGGNATGFISFQESLSGKWLQLLKQMAPQVSRAAVLFAASDRVFFADPFLPALHVAAQSLGVELSETPLADASAIEGVIGDLTREQGGGLVIVPDQLTLINRDRITAFAAVRRLPAIGTYRITVENGGLMSYGADPVTQWGQAAGYVDRVLKGANPADLPVQAPTKYELALNLRTAEALGLTVPTTLLATADEVIE